MFEVDGAPVRDRDERLAKLFLDEPGNALARAAEVARDSSRFNLESSIGTVNKPLLVIAYFSRDTSHGSVSRSDRSTRARLKTRAARRGQRTARYFQSGQADDPSQRRCERRLARSWPYVD